MYANDRARLEAHSSVDAPDCAQLAEARRDLLKRAVFLTQDRDLAEDLVQETMLRALTTGPSFLDPGRRRAWHHLVLRNLFIDRVRARHAITALEVDPADASQEYVVGPLDVIRDVDIVNALRLLSDAERVLMNRVYLQRQSYQQIADETGAPLNTVGTRILRAKQRLRRILAPVVERRLARLRNTNDRRLPDRNMSGPVLGDRSDRTECGVVERAV
jgi:RNA polymerase sigma-70 factor (ECF subfamily)